MNKMDRKSSDSCSPKLDSSDLKFTAVRVDLRHVTSDRRASRSQVLVISDRTSGLDVKKMVAEKNDIAESLIQQLQLVAYITRGEKKSKLNVSDDDNVQIKLGKSSDASVSFSLKWKTSAGDVKHPSNVKDAEIVDVVRKNGDDQRNSAKNLNGLRRTKSNAKSGEMTEIRNGMFLPGYRGSLPMHAKRTELAGVLSQVLPSKNRQPVRLDGECIIHYEPQDPMPRNIVGNSQKSPGTLQTSRSPRGLQEVSPLSNFPRQHVVERTGESQQNGSVKHFEKHSKIHKELSSGHPKKLENSSSYHEEISKTPTKCSNSEKTFRPLAMNSVSVGRTESGDAPTSSARFKSISHTSNQNSCPTTVASNSSIQNGEQRESKFSSLPNMDQLEERNRVVSDTDEVERTPSVSSLPYINSNGESNPGRRCLPQLGVPEAIVEEKRYALSQKLQKRLSLVDKTNKGKHCDVTKRRNVAGALNRPNGSTKSSAVTGAEAEDKDEDWDDTMSMTSWEVAEILATADPMKPQDSDYEDSSPDEDEKFPTNVRTSEMSPSESDADTLDGSSGESDHQTSSSAHEFSPIGRTVARRKQGSSASKESGSVPLVERNKEHNSDCQTKAPIKPITENVPDSQLAAIKQCPERRYLKAPSLFKLLRNNKFRFLTSVLHKKSSAKNPGRLPFEIFNDVIHIDDANRSQQSNAGAATERFMAPVIGDSSDSPDDWECLEGSVQAGDVVVEVNGRIVLHDSASTVVSTCLRFSDNLQLLVARQRNPN